MRATYKVVPKSQDIFKQSSDTFNWAKNKLVYTGNVNKTTTVWIYWQKFNTSVDIVSADLCGFMHRNTKETVNSKYPLSPIKLQPSYILQANTTKKKKKKSGMHAV